MDPASNDWPRTRVIRSHFLTQILLVDPYRSDIPRQGVNIEGAWITTSLDMYHASIDRALGLTHCKFDSNVQLDYFDTSDIFDLTGSRIAGTLRGQGARFGRGLWLADSYVGQIFLPFATAPNFDLDKSTVIRSINLQGIETRNLQMRSLQANDTVLLRAARISEQLTLHGATIGMRLNMNSIRAGGVRLNDGHFAEIALDAARIESALEFSGASVDGSVNAASAQIGGDLLLQSDTSGPTHLQNADFGFSKIGGALIGNSAVITGPLTLDLLEVAKKVTFSNSQLASVSADYMRVGGQFAFSGSKLAGPFHAERLSVAGDFFAREIETLPDSNLDLAYTEIGGNLDIRGSTLPTVTLVGAKIGGDLRLGATATSRTT